MPILKKEPDLYPEELLENSAEVSPAGQWFAMYTLSRREKDLMRRLRAQNIAHYGPMVPNRSRSPQGRIRTSYMPLFAGYVFVYGTEEDRYNAVATGCISKVIDVSDAGQLVTDLCQVRLLVEHGEDLRAEVRPVVGQRARIIRGPLKERELTGTITR